ncbi:MAG TPA: hypothetical protein PK691_09745 [Thermomicrobiales bacterium]|nr:hypothetical protein [Thermomicrobiales bacterium]
MAVVDWVMDAVPDGSEDEVLETVLDEMSAETGEPDSVIDQLRDEALDVVRNLLLQTHPDLPPDLIQGETLQELLESVLTAEQVFAKVAEVLDRRRAEAKPPTVPAGGVRSIPIADLSADGLIRAALTTL